MEKTLQQQYDLIKEGKGNKDHFLKQARNIFPEYITSLTTFDNAVHILKGKSILSESVKEIHTENNWFKIFEENTNSKKTFWWIMIEKEGKKFYLKNAPYFSSEKEAHDYAKKHRVKNYSLKSKEENVDNDGKIISEAVGVKNTKEYGNQNEFEKIDKDVQKDLDNQFNNKDDKNIDNIYGQSFLMGYYTEMKDPKNSKKTVDELKAIVAKNMAKDINYYHTKASFGVKDIGYEKSAEPKAPTGKHKSSGYGNLKEGVQSIGSIVKPEDNNFKIGDKVIYKGAAHVVTRITDDDRIYIRSIKYGGRPDVWVKPQDLKKSKSVKEAIHTLDVDLSKIKTWDDLSRLVNLTQEEESWLMDQIESLDKKELLNIISQKFNKETGKRDILHSYFSKKLKEGIFDHPMMGGITDNPQTNIKTPKDGGYSPIQWSYDNAQRKYKSEIDTLPDEELESFLMEKGVHPIAITQILQKREETGTLNENNNKTGLMIKGRTQIDNNEIGKIFDENSLIFYWDAVQGCWFIPERKTDYDQLEKDIDDLLSDYDVSYSIEQIWNESLNENTMIKLRDLLEEGEYYDIPKKDDKKKPKKEEKKPVKKSLIADKIKEIEQQGSIAALEAKMTALDEEIQERENKLKMVEENEALSEFVNETRVSEMQKEIKELQKAKEKYSKMHEKMADGKKSPEVIDEESDDEDKKPYRSTKNASALYGRTSHAKKTGKEDKETTLNRLGIEKSQPQTPSSKIQMVKGVPHTMKDGKLVPLKSQGVRSK